MCGVFGFVASPGKSVDMKRLRDVACATEARGNHAFGFTWADQDDKIYYFKKAGKISENLDLLTMAADAKIIVGHCRWATNGSVAKNHNNHPHLAHSGCYVHNGVISNYLDIARRRQLTLKTECDSEVIGRLIETGNGSTLRRLRDATRVCTRPERDDRWARFACGSGFVVLGIWDEGQGPALYGARSWNPLRACQAKSGHYLASLPGGLTRDQGDVPNGTCFKLNSHTYEAVQVNPAPRQSDLVEYF